MNIYVCPMCKEIIISEDEIFCDVCQREFVLEDGILIEQPISYERRFQ
jgi:uncharacterized protein YbaR (Trm112 family)